MPEDRRHIAVMFTDIVGYTALMGSDENKAFEMLKRNHTIHAALVKKHNGKLVKEIGDGTLASFSLGSDAVRCAIEIQKESKSQKIPLKIGIHEGEMVMAGEDVLGDGVNVASRLQEISADGSITISGRVYSDVKNKAGIKTKLIGDKRLKNVEDPVKVYKVFWEEEKEKPIEGEEMKSKFRLLYYVMAGIVVILVVVILWQFLPSKETNPTIPEVVDKSIAVLPFRNDSPDQENEYFCNGMVESILTNLQKIGDLQLKSRTDVEQYRKPDKDLASIAKELKVAFILEGSVQKVGDNILVSAQLIDGKTGNHLWADNYDGKYTDEIFAFQKNVAKKIAASLQAVITPEEEKRLDKKSTSEIMAFDLYWRGMDMVDNFVATNHEKYLESANVLFEKSLMIDPDYASAVFGKGHSLKMKADKSSRNYDSAMVYADRAILLDPMNKDGYGLKASIYSEEWQNDLAIEYYLKSVELDPDWNWTNLLLGIVYLRENDYQNGLHYINESLKGEGRAWPDFYAHLGHFFHFVRDYERSMKYYRRSLILLPRDATITGYFQTLLCQHKIQEAVYYLDSICTKFESESICYRLKFYAYLNLKNYDQAEKHFNQLLNDTDRPNVQDSIWFSYLLKEKGRDKEANIILQNCYDIIEKRMSENKTYMMLINLSAIYAIQNDNSASLKYLESACAIRGFRPYDNLIEIDPIFESLWDDPEFTAIVKRVKSNKAAFRAQFQEMVDKGEIDL
jgi:adenylate cyclase